MLSLRWGHAVASIGAFVTVAALAIDPFTQQLLHYYSCSVVVPGIQATLPRTNLYDQLGFRVSTIINTLSVGMQSAIAAGVYNPERIGVPFT